MAHEQTYDPVTQDLWGTRNLGLRWHYWPAGHSEALCGAKWVWCFEDIRPEAPPLDKRCVKCVSQLQPATDDAEDIPLSLPREGVYDSLPK